MTDQWTNMGPIGNPIITLCANPSGGAITVTGPAKVVSIHTTWTLGPGETSDFVTRFGPPDEFGDRRGCWVRVPV